MNEYNVGHKTGFMEALDEYNREIMIKHCESGCGDCLYVVCPFDTIREEIKERYNDKTIK